MSISVKKKYIFRKLRTRSKVFGTSERPRLNVYRSLKHIHAQIKDDLKGRTLVSASSSEPEVKGKLKKCGNLHSSQVVGELLAGRAKSKKIAKVVFDRGGRIYSGRVKALAESARKAGLEF